MLNDIDISNILFWKMSAGTEFCVQKSEECLLKYKIGPKCLPRILDLIGRLERNELEEFLLFLKKSAKGHTDEELALIMLISYW